MTWLLTNFKKIIELQNDTEFDILDYKNYDFNKVSLTFIFLKDIYTHDLSIKDADDEQSNLIKKLGILNKGRRSSEKIYFLKNVEKSLK